MDKYRWITWIVVVWLAALSNVVMCYGQDGHVDLKGTVGGDCVSDSGAAAQKAVEPNSSTRLLIAIPDSDCVDLPVWSALVLTTSSAFSAETMKLVKVADMSSGSLYDFLGGDERRLFSQRHAHAIPDPFLMQIQSVVLLI